MIEKVRADIAAAADAKYRDFHAALVPGVGNITGVRIPVLRGIAKEIARGDWRTFLDEADQRTYEETMLQGLVIGYARADVDELLGRLAVFVPKIDNWAVCDSVCSGLKFTGRHQEVVWYFLRPYLDSKKEFEQRFGVIMMLAHYVEENWIDRVIDRLDKVRGEAYYTAMGVAWALSVCYVKFPDKTMEYLERSTHSDFVYNKALQKIIESNRVDATAKDIVRAMKRR